MTMLAALLSPGSVQAAELYGRFFSADPAILAGARIEVTCGSWRESDRGIAIAADGRYVVRAIPGGRGCSFVISHADYGESGRVNFNTNRSVVKIDAELRLRGRQILVLRR